MGNDNMKLRVTLLATCIAATLAAVAPAQSANLLEVYQRALQNDPVIREAEANRLATLENKPQARAGLLPQLTASGTYTQGDTDFTRAQFFDTDDNPDTPPEAQTLTTSGRD